MSGLHSLTITTDGAKLTGSAMVFLDGDPTRVPLSDIDISRISRIVADAATRLGKDLTDAIHEGIARQGRDVGEGVVATAVALGGPFAGMS